MQLLYALVLSIPFLHMISVMATFRRIRNWRSNHAQHPIRGETVRFIVLPLLWNAVLACILLIFLPMAFDANLQAMILFQPVIGWKAIISGFAIAWGVLRTGIVISAVRQNFDHPQTLRLLSHCSMLEIA